MNLETVKKIVSQYKKLKKLDYKNELLSYILIYRKGEGPDFHFIRQHDFLARFGDVAYVMNANCGETMRKLFGPALKNYEQALDNEIITLENKILERDWGVKI